MEVVKRLASVIVIALIAMPIISLPVAADGGSWSYPTKYDIPKLLHEQSQVAVINYQDGIEKLLLTIGISQSDLSYSGRIFWIFPIPANADDIVVSINQDITMPEFVGKYTDVQAFMKMRYAFLWSYSTQLYALPFGLAFIADPFDYYYGPRFYGLFSNDPENPDVTMHQHIDAFGLATEIITAKSGHAIDDYLLTKSISLPSSAVNILDDYIGMNYSFTVTWIDDTVRFTEEVNPYNRSIVNLGVYLTFPTDRIYFPLKLTSVYENETIPIVLKIIDPVVISPDQEFVQGLDIKLEYAYVSDYQVPFTDSLYSFFDEQLVEAKSDSDNGFISFDYTLVMINSSSVMFTDDLWFEERAQTAVQMDYLMIDHYLLFGFLMVMSLSIFSSLVSAEAVFRGYKPSTLKFAFLGLTNFFSIIGLWCVSKRMNVNYEFIDKSILEKPQSGRVGPIPPSVGDYLKLFTIIYVLATAVIQISFYLIIR